LQARKRTLCGFGRLPKELVALRAGCRTVSLGSDLWLRPPNTSSEQLKSRWTTLQANDGNLYLQNSALLYPAAGFSADEDHFSVMLDGQEIGTIYRIGEEWLWSINIGMMEMGAGRAVGRREAREAFRAEWDAEAARLRPGHVERALAVARGKA
jgi:hypothetical protein